MLHEGLTYDIVITNQKSSLPQSALFWAALGYQCVHLTKWEFLLILKLLEACTNQVQTPGNSGLEGPHQNTPKFRSFLV